LSISSEGVHGVADSEVEGQEVCDLRLRDDEEASDIVNVGTRDASLICGEKVVCEQYY